MSVKNSEYNWQTECANISLESWFVPFVGEYRRLLHMHVYFVDICLKETVLNICSLSKLSVIFHSNDNETIKYTCSLSLLNFTICPFQNKNFNMH